MTKCIICGILQESRKYGKIFLTQDGYCTVCNHKYRDFLKRELSDDIKDEIWKKYPHTDHTGCVLCPVLVLWGIYNSPNYERSLQYANQLGVLPYKPF